MKIELNLDQLNVRRICDFYGEEVENIDFVDITEMIEEIISDLPDLIYRQELNKTKRRLEEVEDKYKALRISVKDLVSRLDK